MASLTDDDVTFFPKLLQKTMIKRMDDEKKILQKLGEPVKNYMIGRICWVVPPVRQPPGNGRGRYYISREMYPFEVYPPFSAGMGTLLTPGCINQLFAQTFKIPMNFGQLDDVYLVQKLR